MFPRWLIILVVVLGLLVLGAKSLAAQVPERAPGVLRSTQPVTGARTMTGYPFPAGVTLGVRLEATPRLPFASGEAKVERRRGTTEIEVELDEMKPAAEFGGDFSTYVLWTVSPEGQVQNVGEFILNGNRAKLDVTTALQTFGMMVTAEPHFLVRRPSTFVVLEAVDLVQSGTSRQVPRPILLEYRGFEGIYNYSRESLDRVVEARGEVRSEVKQARIAIELAERAGAERFASDELIDARERLEETFLAAEERRSIGVVTSMAHDVVRMGLEVQILAEERAFQAALDAERDTHADEVRRMELAIRDSRSETDRARLEIERREVLLAMEREARDAARADANDASLRAAAAEAEVLRADRDRELALERMRAALDAVAETRETARGVIVSLPDILFDFDSATLKPEAREVISRICGVLAVTPGYRIEIEGHTDSVGTEDYNQRLSEQRAHGVLDYVEACNLPDTPLRSRGFGESYPIASNDTPAGRERNRRVEIVVTEVAVAAGF